MNRITPCLWFDNQAEEAANFYCGIFRNSKITNITRFGKAGQEIHGKAEGAVMTVDFELDGQAYTGLNGGPMFKFNEAISLQINCDSQEEVDHYWSKLGEGGDPSAQQCGWLKDKFGVSWQVVPTILSELIQGGDSATGQRVMQALLQMKKLDIAILRRAHQSN